MYAHETVAEAVRVALSLETPDVYHAHGSVKRWRWLNESELVSRVAEYFRAAKFPKRAYVRVSGSGKKQSGATNHDLEIGLGDDRTAIEAVYCVAAKGANKVQPQQAKYINGDVMWLVNTPVPSSRHVIAFLPTLTSGYSVQRSGKVYDFSGSEKSLKGTELLLTKCVQATDFTELTQVVSQDLFVRIDTPASGEDPRWSLHERPLLTRTEFLINHTKFVRTCVGQPIDPLWGIVWSSV